MQGRGVRLDWAALNAESPKRSGSWPRRGWRVQDKAARTKDVLTRIPGGLFVMTSSFEGKRGGVIVKSVMPVAEEPLLLAVAAWKGHGLEPIIRDSHYFGVSMIDPNDRVLVRRFSGHLSEHGDQFDSVATERIVSTSPILSRSIIAIDCEVVRHFDIEADHELYIGLVLGAKVCTPEHPLAAHNPARQVSNFKSSSALRRAAERRAARAMEPEGAAPREAGNGELREHAEESAREAAGESLREAPREPRRPKAEKARDRA
jgi:flavin reductase (DIM6/NTAB) family NADH-FMN oxidoreductase RutF